jgi:transposase
MGEPGGGMARYEVSDELWARIQPLLPVKPRRSRWPGRLPLDDRACLNGILFVLLTGIRWTDLPQQLGYGSGMTCWRRLRDWQAAGVWDQLHALLLAQLRAAGRLDLARAVADGSHVRALKGGRQPDRARSTAAGPAPSITS